HQQRYRYRRGDDQRGAAVPQEIPENAHRQHHAQQQVLVDQRNGAADVDRRVEAEFRHQPHFIERTRVQFGQRDVEIVEDLHGVGIVASLQGDVIRRIAAAQVDAEGIGEAETHVGDLVELHGAIAVPGDDQLAQSFDLV